MLDKGLRASKKKKEEMEKLENKLNEMEALNMKLKKWNKLDKRSSYSRVVFKHGCLLEMYLELWRKEEQYLGICIKKNPG